MIELQKDFIIRNCKTSLGTNKMADLMYALVMCKCHSITSHGVGIYNFSRSQNSRNKVCFAFFIHPNQIEKFEKLAGLKLIEPIEVTLN